MRRKIIRIATINFIIVLSLIFATEWLLRAFGSPVDTGMSFNPDVIDPFFVTDPSDPEFWITNPKLSGPEFKLDFEGFGDNHKIMRQRFSKKIPEGAYRILVVGSSPIYGSSLPSWHNLSTQLALRLWEARPNIRFEIIDASREDFSADDMEVIARNILPMELNLIVCYPGGAVPTLSNIDGLDHSNSLFIRLLRHSEILQLISHLSDPGPDDGIPGHELANRPDQLDLKTAAMIEEVKILETRNYKHYLARIFDLFKKDDRQVIVMTAATNFSDFKPIWSLHHEKLRGDRLRSFASLLQKAKSDLQISKYDDALNAISEALAISDSYAEAHFVLGKIHEAQGNFNEARKAFIESREKDASHERIFAEPTALIKAIGKDYGFHIIDSEDILMSKTPDGLVGGRFFRDHTHLNILGMTILADNVSTFIIDNMNLPEGGANNEKPPLPPFSWVDENYGLKLQGRSAEHQGIFQKNPGPPPPPPAN